MVLVSNILNIFAQSPFKPIEQHMKEIDVCVTQLIPFCELALQERWDEAEKIQKKINESESKADNLKKEIRLHLPSGLFMPVDRADLLHLIALQDKMAGKAKHISSLMIARKMVFPKEISSEFFALVNRCVDACKQAKKAIDELDELVETGFRGKEVEIAQNMILELDQLERDTDALQMIVRQKLFTIEKTLNPVEVMFLYKTVDWTAELADRAQQVGHRLESLLAK